MYYETITDMLTESVRLITAYEQPTPGMDENDETNETEEDDENDMDQETEEDESDMSEDDAAERA